MKRIVLWTAAVLAIALLMALTACATPPKPAPASQDAKTEAPAPVSEPMRMIENPENNDRDAARAWAAEIKTVAPTPDGAKLEGIPVYAEEDLLYKMSLLGRDLSIHFATNSRVISVSSVYASCPGAQCRVFEDGHAFMVYDTDSGYRLFLPISQGYEYTCISGYPVLVKDLLSHADFEGLKVGDSIDAVCAIDSVGEVYKKILEDENFNSVYTENMKKSGRPFASMHYLTDGILRIDYVMDDERNVTVDNMVYSPDYMINDCLGNHVNYRIAEADLP